VLSSSAGWSFTAAAERVSSGFEAPTGDIGSSDAAITALEYEEITCSQSRVGRVWENQVGIIEAVRSKFLITTLLNVRFYALPVGSGVDARRWGGESLTEACIPAADGRPASTQPVTLPAVCPFDLQGSINGSQIRTMELGDKKHGGMTIPFQGIFIAT
jgi:hypothetical protein